MSPHFSWTWDRNFRESAEEKPLLHYLHGWIKLWLSVSGHHQILIAAVDSGCLSSITDCAGAPACEEGTERAP